MGSSEWHGWLVQGLEGGRLESQRQRGLGKGMLDNLRKWTGSVKVFERHVKAQQRTSAVEEILNNETA